MTLPHNEEQALPVKRAVAIGASAGAIESLMAILPQLPAHYPWPIFVVVHLPPDKKSLLAELFEQRCNIHAIEAEDKTPIAPGSVFFAPADYHMLVEQDESLSLSTEDPVLFSRPSIDVMFESAIDAYGNGLIGIILSGANEDGARGLRHVINGGGTALVQKPDTAHSSAMPLAALKICPEASSLTLQDIADYLQKAGTL